MKSVVQLERTGCAIASAAAIAGVSYRRAQAVGRSLGIMATNKNLGSSTEPIRTLLKSLGVRTQRTEEPFRSWRRLPDIALLAIKWHLEGGKPFWHWVVFVREGERQYVLDSKASLRKHVRTDFGRMKPKWYIGIADAQPHAAADSHRRASPAGS
jgi:ABC-type bacteriocin/lantibiotic exporter with double-glycine peptidase domain